MHALVAARAVWVGYFRSAAGALPPMTVVSVVGSLLMVAACSRDESPVSTADSPPVLNVYNWDEFIDPSVIKDFEHDTGIKVHYDVYDSNETMEVKLLAGHTGYDLAVPGGAFFGKEVRAGVYQKLDKAQLPNLQNLDPDAVRATAVYDPGNQYGVDYMWLVATGMAYDAGQIKARLADAPVDSWRLIFDPAVVAKFQSCGVAVLDSPEDVVAGALALLGKDPNSEASEDLEAAERVLMSIRPFIRYVDSSRYVSDLANGDLCLALAWSGDLVQARHRAIEAGKQRTLVFNVPAEGSVSAVDVLAIPADAPHVKQAHAFINYLLRPDIAARNTMACWYASGVAGVPALLDESARNDSDIFLSPPVRARLAPLKVKSQAYTRALTRVWTRFKTGH